MHEDIKYNIHIKHTLRYVFIILTLLYFTACQNTPVNDASDESGLYFSNSDSSASLKDVSLMPYWYTSAQFAGFYVGKEKGIYEKYGIRLNIIPFHESNPTEDSIKAGNFDFAVLWLVNALQLKDQGADIVNIAQLSSRSSLMLLTKKTSGINSIKKMNGKKASIWKGFELQPQVLFKKNSIDVNTISIGSSNSLFLMDAVDITNANWFDEYHSIINSGLNPEELNTFFFADHGMNFVEDGLYCTSDKMKNAPDLCRDFVKATLESWKYAYEHPDTAVSIVIRYAENDKVPVNTSHMRWMLDRYKDLYLPEGTSEINTLLSDTNYNNVCSILKEYGCISTIPPFQSFYVPALTLKK